MPIPSHHFVLVAELAISIPKIDCGKTSQRPNYGALADKQCSALYWIKFDALMEDSCAADTDDVNVKYAAMTDAIRQTTDCTLPKSSVQQKRPWISEATLHLIGLRQLARTEGQSEQESWLKTQIRLAMRNAGADGLMIWLQVAPGMSYASCARVLS